MLKSQSGNSLGIVAICKNEEKDIEGFLKNVYKLANEIVIVDDGSTDNTLEKIRNFNSDIHIINTRMGKEGYAGLRNEGIKKIGTEWVLSMDIDERITPELYREIKLNINKNEFVAFKFKRLNFFLNHKVKYGGWGSWNHHQLARRKFHYFEGVIHEKVIITNFGELKIGQLKSVMWHLGDSYYNERVLKSLNYSKAEASKKNNYEKKITGARIFYAFAKEFIKNFIFKRGFLDGTIGVITALHSADSVFRTYTYLWENKNSIKRNEIEKILSRKWGNNE